MIPLLVDLETEWRGGQNQALLTAQGMLACGHDAQLVAIRDSPLARRAAQAGIQVHEVAARARRSRAALIVRSLLSQKKFDVVHANEPHALTAVWLAAAHRKVPVVVSRRVAYPLQNNSIARSRYLMTQRILAVSRFVAASVVESRIPADKVEVVYEGVEVPPTIAPETHERARQRWGVAGNQRLLGCVGYLLPEKGQESVLRAMREVRAKFPGTRLLLAGDGPCRERLDGLAKQFDLQDAVIFAGFVEYFCFPIAGRTAWHVAAGRNGVGTSGVGGSERRRAGICPGRGKWIADCRIRSWAGSGRIIALANE
jgi:glycosyltransferase involved in cell wall biosynthesis